MQMLTGIDQSDYSKLETGKRYYTYEQLKRIALAIGYQHGLSGWFNRREKALSPQEGLTSDRGI